MSVMPAGREEGEIQAILLDSGLEDDADLRRSLEELRMFAQEPAPQPRADLAALLAHGAPASGLPARPMRRASTPDVASLEQHRRNRQRRMGMVVGAAVVGAMGLGAGAVAASSEDFRNSVGHTVVRMFQPAGGTTAPVPTLTSPADIPAAPAPTVAAPKPSGSGTAGSPSGPANPVQAGPGGSSNSSAGSAASGGTAKSEVPTSAHPSQLPTVPGTGLAPNLPAKPLPAVPTLPGVPTVPAKPVPGTP